MARTLSPDRSASSCCDSPADWRHARSRALNPPASMLSAPHKVSATSCQAEMARLAVSSYVALYRFVRILCITKNVTFGHKPTRAQPGVRGVNRALVAVRHSHTSNRSNIRRWSRSVGDLQHDHGRFTAHRTAAEFP